MNAIAEWLEHWIFSLKACGLIPVFCASGAWWGETVSVSQIHICVGMLVSEHHLCEFACRRPGIHGKDPVIQHSLHFKNAL